MGQPPPQYGQPYQPPRRVKAVTKRRGLSGGSHTFHLLMTIFTCGAWGIFVWFPLWLLRMIVRRKEKTIYRA